MAIKNPSHYGTKLLAGADRHEVAVLILRTPHPTMSATGRSTNREEGAPIPIDDDGIGNIVAAAARTKPWPLIAAAPVVSTTGRLGGSSRRRVFITAFVKEVHNPIAGRPLTPRGRRLATP